MFLQAFSKQVVLRALVEVFMREVICISCEDITTHDYPSSLNGAVTIIIGFDKMLKDLVNLETFKCIALNTFWLHGGYVHSN